MYGENIPEVVYSDLMQNWLNSFDTAKYVLSEVHIFDVDYWNGKTPTVISIRVRFTDKATNSTVQRMVVLTPNSVACLILVRNKDLANAPFARPLVALVKQDRVVIGESNFLEALAGRLNKGTDAVTQMVAEIDEESGMKVSEQDLKYLGSAYSSCGIISESISYFLCSVWLTGDEIKLLENGEFGAEGENEHTQVQLYEPEVLFLSLNMGYIQDQKLLTALGFLAAMNPDTSLRLILR
jgi:hypothetical protein